MPFTAETVSVSEADKLIATYKKAYLGILARIDDSKDFTLARRTVLLAEINNDLRRLKVDTDKWLEDELPTQYYAGTRKAQDQLKELQKKTNIDLLATTKATTQYNKRAVQALISDSSEAFAQAMQGIGRSVRSLTSQAVQLEIRQNIAEGFITGSTRREITGQVKDIIKRQGLAAIKDRGGRTWTIDRYAEMLVRTKMVEARNSGMINTMLANNNDLVQVSRNGSEHKVCARYEGKILSLTGNTPGYTTLEEAKDAGLFHPNCKHNINAVNVSLAEKTYGYNKDTKQYEKGVLV